MLETGTESNKIGIWKQVLEALRFDSSGMDGILLGSLECAELTDGKIVLKAPSRLHAERAQKKFLPLIKDALLDLTGNPYEVAIEEGGASQAVSGAKAAPEKTEPPPTAAPVVKTKDAPVSNAVRETVAPAAPRSPKKPLGLPLGVDYTFERYIVGENNRFASNAALAVSKNPGKAYNPLLIYGGVGLGKTHLMQAIGHRLSDIDDFKVVYTTAESFTNEFTECFGAATQGKSKITAFKNKYRHADALLIDDIHFFTKKEGTQEELFHTFNALYDSSKQIIFTCDRPVSELKNIADRMRNRFERGLNVDLLPPNYETKCVILQKKALERKIDLPDTVIDLISSNVQTNVRDLEASLTKLAAYAELVGSEITLEIAKEQLSKEFSFQNRTQDLTIDQIAKVVAEHFDTSVSALKSNSRTKTLALARSIAMYITCLHTECTQDEIGGYFGGKTHSTVSHARRRIEEDYIKLEPGGQGVIDLLVRKIKDISRGA